MECCRKCGRPLAEHAAWNEGPVPEGAVEADFGLEGMTGVYCLPPVPPG
jgi:hypothetical protein